MTIDEAIEHSGEKAKEQRYYASFERNGMMYQSCIKCAEEHEQLAEWLEQLKEYKQLEEQGRLIKLPCKIGSVLYEINDLTGFITERDIDKIEIFECPTPHIFLTSGRYYRMSASRDFGRTVFATKSEAEAKLKELRGGENGSME